MAEEEKDKNHIIKIHYGHRALYPTINSINAIIEDLKDTNNEYLDHHRGFVSAYALIMGNQCNLSDENILMIDEAFHYLNETFKNELKKRGLDSYISIKNLYETKWDIISPILYPE